MARRRERLEALAEQIGCEYWAADLTDEAHVKEIAAPIMEGSPVDALVNIWHCFTSPCPRDRQTSRMPPPAWKKKKKLNNT